MFKCIASIMAIVLTVIVSTFCATQPVAAATTESPPIAYSFIVPVALPQSASPCKATYTVHSGDSLGNISSRYGMRWNQVWQANPWIANPNRIYPGQHICIPGNSSPPPSKSPVTYTTLSDTVPIGNRWYPNTAAYGQCVWYVQNVRHDLNLSGSGAAANIPYVARSRGYATGWTPKINAIAVFPPGNQGANRSYGHTAIVKGTYSNGTFLVWEMNTYGFKALDGSPSGFAKINARVYSTNGVSFVYN